MKRTPATAEELQALCESDLITSVAGSTIVPLMGQPRRGPTILTSGEFIEGFVPPDYLFDRILQRRFIYGLTGQTGAGKTAISLLMTACVGLCRNLGNHEVTGGRVLYFAGENPDDIRMRWIAMSEVMGFEVTDVGVYFVPGVFKLSEFYSTIRRQVEAIGGVDFVITDTSAAYYEGSDENENVAMGAHARRLRELTLLPGGPTVLVNCHPVKNAGADNLLPRGGGAFLAEIDGNLTCTKKDDLVELHWQGKFRGPDFEPLTFTLVPTKTDRLVDSRGRQIPTVIAKVVTEAELADIKKRHVRDEDTLLVTMKANPGASIATLAVAAEWHMKNGQPYKSLVQRLLKSLERDKLVQVERGTWTLTPKGAAEAERDQKNMQLAGARHA